MPVRAQFAFSLIASTLALGLISCNIARAAAPEPVKLPLKRVVLFSSGVGFFQHNGEVSGNTRVEFPFKAAGINDLLKSMTVADLDGGKFSTVSYGSKDPVTKTLKTFAIDVTENARRRRLPPSRPGFGRTWSGWTAPATSTSGT